MGESILLVPQNDDLPKLLDRPEMPSTASDVDMPMSPVNSSQKKKKNKRKIPAKLVQTKSTKDVERTPASLRRPVASTMRELRRLVKNCPTMAPMDMTVPPNFSED